MRLATSADIKKLDNLASQKYGIPLDKLMENAGKAVFDEIIKEFPSGKFAVFCGKGNNGGDGFVIARLLKEKGNEVKVYLTHSEDEIRGIAKIAFDKMKSENVEVLEVSAPVNSGVIIIDALLGISLAGAPRGNIKDAIDKINSMKTTVISVDTPSGLSADDGSTPGSVVKANYTYTLALDKVGLNTDMARTLCGIKKVLDIGIPDEAVEELGVVEK